MLGNLKPTYVIYKFEFQCGTVGAALICLDNSNPYPDLNLLQGVVKFESKTLNGVFSCECFNCAFSTGFPFNLEDF